MLFASACGTDAKTPALTVNDAAATLVALTFEAATQTAAASTPTPFPSPVPTPTIAKPILYFPLEARCRTGPTANFKIIGTFPAGTTVEMIGRDSSRSAWLVRIPNSADACWVQAQDGSPGGDIQSLPEVTPQPVSVNTPSPVLSIAYDFYCSYTDNVTLSVTTQLKWFVLSNNDANGYRVYRSDALVADVPADTTTYTDTASVVVGTQSVYSVEAYNEAGVSARKTISFTCK